MKKIEQGIWVFNLLFTLPFVGMITNGVAWDLFYAFIIWAYISGITKELNTMLARKRWDDIDYYFHKVSRRNLQ